MFGETTISYVKIWNHPIETTIYKWLALGFQVPLNSLSHSFLGMIKLPLQSLWVTSNDRGSEGQGLNVLVHIICIRSIMLY